MLIETYCLLTGGRCSYYPVILELNSFFISEPYDKLRRKRENAILEAIRGHRYEIADHKIRNIAITCKICQQIQSSMFGIVDITGSNENVLIELGMLYGFNRPVVILVEQTEKTKIRVPSNIIGIEQVRYSDFAELTKKLRTTLSALFTLTKRQEEYLLNLKPILDSQIHRLEIALETKRLKEGFKAKIIDFKEINNVGYVIIDKGRNQGVRDDMLFSVFQADKKVKGSYLEETVGVVVVTHSQQKIAQCQLWSYDPSHSFWTNTFYSKPPRNFVRAYVLEDYDIMSEEEIEEAISTYKLMLRYNLMGRF